jgi:polysaccharide biosynthesis transport protein
MSVQDFLRLLRRYWLLTLSMLLLGIASGAAATLLVTPQYTATSEVIVQVVPQSDDPAGLAQGTSFAQKTVDTYAVVAVSPTILQPVITDLGLQTTPDALKRRMSVDAGSSSAVMDINVSDRSRDTAAEIANRATDELSAFVSDLTKGPKGVGTVKIKQIAEATPPPSPSSPNVPINLLVGGIVGLIVAGALIALRRLLVNKVDSLEDLAALTESPIVGEIVRDRNVARRPLRMLGDPMGGFAESVRDLRTNLQFLTTAKHAQTIVITSAAAGEGKTTTAANLALALAAAQSVVVVDADLRKPRLAEAFGIDDVIGLTDVLVGNATLDQALQTIGDSDLQVLPAGRRPPNSAELLQSDAMQEVIRELSERFGTVLFDTAPAGILSDARVLARECSGALVICALGHSKRPLMRAALEGLELSGAKTLGVVATFVPARRSAYYYDHADVPKERKREPKPRWSLFGRRHISGQNT